MSFLLFCLSTVGATIIVTEGAIFEPMRLAVKARSYWLGKLVSCSMCFGVWCGWAITALMLWSTGETPHAYHVLWGFASSFLSYTAMLVQNTIEAHCVRITAINEGGEQ